MDSICKRSELSQGRFDVTYFFLRMSKSQPEISGDRLSSDVANYMCKLFKHSLAVTTLHPNPPVTPVQPPGWSEELLVTCQNTVRTLVVAFTNIGMLNFSSRRSYCLYLHIRIHLMGLC